MRVLLVSPLGFPINKTTKYAGIELLVYQYASELAKEHDVLVMARSDSIFPSNVKVLSYHFRPNEDLFLLSELHHFQQYQSYFRKVDIIHDFSHQHLASRYMPNMPTLNIFWHAPSLAQYPKAPYNIIGLSEWACREFHRVYKQKARYQQSICVDVNVYKLSDAPRNNRFLCVGRMGEEKGNLNAAKLCRDLNVELDIITARGTEALNMPYTDYEKEVMALADGEKIKIWWEKDYTTESKIEMMQNHKALLYITDHPEVTTHKGLEALLCGCPVITSRLGASPEWVEHGIDGYLCATEQEFTEAIKSIDKLNAVVSNERLKQKYSIENVIKEYIPLYKEVKGGLRW